MRHLPQDVAGSSFGGRGIHLGWLGSIIQPVISCDIASPQPSVRDGSKGFLLPSQAKVHTPHVYHVHLLSKYWQRDAANAHLVQPVHLFRQMPDKMLIGYHSSTKYCGHVVIHQSFQLIYFFFSLFLPLRNYAWPNRASFSIDRPKAQERSVYWRLGTCFSFLSRSLSLPSTEPFTRLGHRPTHIYIVVHSIYILHKVGFSAIKEYVCAFMQPMHFLGLLMVSWLPKGGEYRFQLGGIANKKFNANTPKTKRNQSPSL